MKHLDGNYQLLTSNVIIPKVTKNLGVIDNFFLKF